MQSFPFDSELTYDEHNNPIYDRAVSSQPLRKLIRELFTTGVMPNPSTNLQVSAGNDGMTVQIAAGFAVIDGGLCQEKETRTLEVTAADNTYDRIDTVVLRWNENVDVRTADLYVIAGTPAVNPVRPTLQRNNSIYEIGLADVFITKRVATITNDKITDTRYESERCGIVSSVSEWDTTTIYQQIQAELAGFKADEEANFATWFDSMKDQLSEDAAGHLQQEIDELQPVRKRTITNLLNPTITTKTETGITCTNNGDGTYTLNGTATANTFFDVNDGSTPMTLSQGEYRYCGTPSGASANTFKSGLIKTDGSGVIADDTGDGFTFQLDGTTKFVFRMVVYEGVTVDNVVFKPMITTDIYASYDDYVQYSGDGEINKNVAKQAKDIAQLNANLSARDGQKFQFSKSGTKYGYTINGVFHPFSGGAVLIGTYSSDTTINVSAYSPTSASQFLAVCDTDKSTSAEWGNGKEGNFGMGWLHASARFTAPKKNLNGNTLSLTVGKITHSASAPSGGGSATSNLPTKVYYVGDIESA